MTDHQWHPEFEKMLRSYLRQLPADEPITPDLSLVDYGLDSLATVSLLLSLEDTFEVSIPDHLLTESTFGTPAGLWSVVGSLATDAPVE